VAPDRRTDQDGRMSDQTPARTAASTPAGWARLDDRFVTRIPTPDFATGLALVAAIGAAAERAGHHPDLDLRYTAVDVGLTSHDTGGVTDRDVRLAATISQLAADAGLTPSAAGATRLELGLDSPDGTALAPFWAAITGTTVRDDAVVDASDRLPAIWFQPSGAEEPRQRWHPDLWVDPAEVQPRIDAAVAAGGRLISDADAPRFWVLADPEDNRVCLCTWQDRQP
jgi:4a-hydroxytetrahydrobiopterin dehydratase